MKALAQILTLTDDQGANPISFGVIHSKDLEDDLKAAALARATEVHAVEETGVTFDYLSREVRSDFYWDDRVLEGRFLEKLYPVALRKETSPPRKLPTSRN